MLLTLSFRNWLFEYFDSQCGHTSVCVNLSGISQTFFQPAGTLRIKTSFGFFFMGRMTTFPCHKLDSPFLVECSNRFEAETQNWKGPHCSSSPPGSREGVSDSDPYRSEAGTGISGEARVGITCIQYCTWHLRFWKHIPFQTVVVGSCRPSVAKSSDIQKRCQKQISVCEISQLTFFFYIMWGRVKQNMFMSQIVSPVYNLCI